METHVVRRIDKTINKDVDTGILIHVVIYKTDLIEHPLAFMVGMHVIPPDMFEIVIPDGLDPTKELVINLIDKAISELRLVDRTISNCPICGGQIFGTLSPVSEKGQYVACFNLACHYSGDIPSIMKYKLRHLSPNASDAIFEHLIRIIIANKPNQVFTIIDIIEYAIYLRLNPSDPNYHPEIDVLINDLRNLTISGFIEACTICSISSDMDLAISYYDDSIVKLLADVKQMCRGLRNNVMDRNLGTVLTAMIGTNNSLFKLLSPIM